MTGPRAKDLSIINFALVRPARVILILSKGAIKLVAKLQSSFRPTTKAARDGVNKAPYSAVILLTTDLRDFRRKARRTSQVFQAASVTEQWSLPGGL
jgi:hypothetical protein